MADHVEFYFDAAEEVRWRYKAGNNETVADSGEGYENIQDAQRACSQVTYRTLVFGEGGGVITAATVPLENRDTLEARWV